VTAGNGFEVRVRGRIGRAALRAFEPWTVQGIDGHTSILIPHADDSALHSLIYRLDDFGLEFVEVVPLSAATARALRQAR
jgi:hypothetical protein